MKIKMLRTTSDGGVEAYYVDSPRHKKLVDNERKKGRRMNDMSIREGESERKIDLRTRQKLASDLRDIKKILKEVNVETTEEN